MRLAGQFWVIDEPAAPSDALIVLGDDNYRRIARFTPRNSIAREWPPWS